MDVKPLKFLVLAAFMCGFLPILNTAKADGWFYFDPVKFEAAISFNGSLRRDDTGNTAQDSNWKTGLKLSQNMYFLDPGIATLSLQLEPAYSWQYADYTYNRSNGNRVEVEDFSGRLLSYAVNASLFRDMPIPIVADFGAQQGTSINNGSLGSRYRSESSSWFANVVWEFKPFPMSFRYDQVDFVQSNLSGPRGYLTERDELLKIAAISAESSKLKLEIEHLDMDDRVESRQQDYVSDTIALNHLFSWGRDSSLHSRLNYYDRSGFNGNERFTLEENARIQHTENLSSNSRYRFNTGGQTFTANQHFGEFRMQHQLYSNLYTYGRGAASYLESSGADETLWLTELGAQYQKADLFGAAVSGGASLSYGETNRDSSQLLTEVLDEAYTVPVNGFVLLNSRYILAATIIVTNDDGTVVYVEGADYIVLDEVDGLTQLQILPAGRIVTGDLILVSYKALALPSQKYSTTITSYNLGISLGWVNASHSHRNLDNRRISGASDFFLQDDLNDTTNLQFRWKMADIDTSVSATRNYRKVGVYEATSYVFTQDLTWPYRGSLWSLTLQESFSESKDRNYDSYNLALQARWNPLPNLSINPNLGIWKTVDETFDGNVSYKLDDVYASIGFSLSWWYRDITLSVYYQHNQRDTTRTGVFDRRTLDDRLAFYLTRRFR